MKLVNHLIALEAPKSLSQRQQEYCIQFVLNSGNKAKAAKLSGYALRNSSSIGCRLLRRKDIQSYIRALRAEAKKRLHTPTPETIKGEYVKAENQAVMSLAEFIDLSGGLLRLRTPDELPDGSTDILENIEFNKEGQVTGYRLKDGGVPALQRMIDLSNPKSA